jgi:Fe-S-cluster containining protein
VSPSASEGFPLRFRCQRSGNCCARPGGTVRVGPEDVTRIAAHLEMTEAAFRSRYVAASGDRLADGLGDRCVFLEDGRHTRCGIYAVRPERCRSWPYWDEHRDPVRLAEAARLCPGIEASGAAEADQRRKSR